MAIGLLLAPLDTALESLLVFVRPFKFHLPKFFLVEARVNDLLVDLCLLLLDGLIEVHGRLWRQEGTIGVLLQHDTLSVLLVALLEGLGALRTPVSLLDLLVVVDLEYRLVNVLIEVISCLLLAGPLAPREELCLHFVPQVVIHDQLGILGLFDEPRGSFLVSFAPMVLLLKVCCSRDYRSE